MFSKILIANRGEIACRIARTAREMGVKTVAVYSDADKDAMHCHEADEAISIGGRDAEKGVEPYLLPERIIEAALATGAEAIHPGYGFLSENPFFIESVNHAGLTFIGPSSEAVHAMGLKDAAKHRMEEAGVPVVPGYHGDNQDPDFLYEQAEEIGYPVLIKARAGGGGKGMRKVDHPDDFHSALLGAKREGEASFGDGRVLIEKFITSPRHIEIQVFGDNHGNVVHLFERDCSLQRRHQKVIEEAPAPGMTAEMRDAMGEAAVLAARSIQYSGAGTIEFIVDGSDGLHPDRFWFMEMNTRLQVEHPVTEAITGVDLVEWQLRVAAGEELPMMQSELEIDGHAFEARLYAEDVPKGFLPATGTLEVLEFSERARNDTGVAEGDAITPFYDPMIAKVITHAETREEALSELEKALGETMIAGTVTNAAFLRALCNHEGFKAGDVDTGLIERDLEALTEEPELTPDVLAKAASEAIDLDDWFDQEPFRVLTGFALHEPDWQYIKLLRGEEVFQIAYRLTSKSVELELVDAEDGLRRKLPAPDTGYDASHIKNGVAVFAPHGTFEFRLPDPLDRDGSDAVSGDAIVAPMPGLVKVVNASSGDAVTKGDALIVLEAMKMEHTLVAPRDGVIAEINVGEGDQVQDGDILLALEEEMAEAS